MRHALRRLLVGSCAFAALCSWVTPLMAVTAPILDKYGATLTTWPVPSATQAMGPRFDERGVDIDGTLRLSVPLGWSVAADALGGGYSAGRTLGDINLCTGAYHPTEIDLSFPTLGLPVVIGRTYSGVQQDGAGNHTDSGGYQGWNWAQVAQPEIVLVQGATADLDVLQIVYGNDRVIEFKRTGLTSTEFKAKNGAAGVITFTAAGVSTPETYTYYDQRGNQIVFLGFDGNAQYGTGQIWKMIDPAGKTAYVYDISNSAAVGSTGYDNFGGVTVWYDASDRRYTFTYSTFGIYRRLQKVEAEINTGSWTSVGKVEYDYYTSTINDVGLSGDLKTVKITMSGVASGPYVRTKYYRYYTRAWSNSNGRRGEAHALKMVVGFDGVRQDASYASDSDSTLLPYSEMYFEYPSGDSRIDNVIVNGNCGCSGGMSGQFFFTYDKLSGGSGYAASIANTTYQNDWQQRTIVTQPDGVYSTHYFDETGAVLARLISSATPSTTPSSMKMWLTSVVRNSDGQVTEIHSPANCPNNNYSHSGWSLSSYGTTGLITKYTRYGTANNLKGLRTAITVQDGTGSPTTTSDVTFSDVQLVVGVSGVSVAQLDTSSTYPNGSALTTTYGHTYYSGSNTSVQYLAADRISTTNPVVVTGSNGSNSATISYVYLRRDGSMAYTKDASGTISYSARDVYGRTVTSIVDCSTSSGDINTSGTPDNDAAGGWSSLSTAGTAIHAKTTMTYDDQGRLLTRTQPSYGPSGSTTRTSTWKYVLDSGKLGAFFSPRYASSNYYGPLSYLRVNHAGKPDRRAIIEVGTPSGTFPTSTSPNTTSGTAWSSLVDTIYDQTGLRSAETWTYTSTSLSDKAYVYYDSMGRIARSIDATGTIRRTVFDERGMVSQRWLGTNDNGATNPAGSGSGTFDLVKTDELEYDNNSSTGGENGYLTKRSQDSSGVWSGGVGDRVSTYQSDYRGRTIVALPPVAPYTVSKYDNSNRVIAVGQYNSPSGLTITTDPTATSASTRVGLNETSFDERGQVWRTRRWEIDQSTGAKGSSLVLDNWYDDNGRLIKTHGPQITKTFLDRLGRPTEQFVLAKVNDSTYSDAATVTGDIVLEQTHSALDAATGRTLARWVIQRAHDDNTGGTTSVLDTNADSDLMKLTAANLQANARAQITGMWYDAWDRLSDVALFGTNGGTFDRNDTGPGPSHPDPTPPTRSLTELRTTYTYDDAGRMATVTDNAGIVNATLYDFAGRKAATIDNLINGNPHTTAGADNDQDRRIDYAYADGLLTSITRELPLAGGVTNVDQVTTYAYNSTGGGSQVASKNLLTVVTNPDSTTTQYTYNALSQVNTTTDPSGNVITNSYDNGGRVTVRVITTLATTPPNVFDGRVNEIDTSYEPRGMVAGVVQKDSGSTVLDEIAFVYDSWGMLASSTQDPDSAIGAASGRDEFVMSWTWARNTAGSGWRNLYLTDWTQPDGGSGLFCAPTYTALGQECDEQVKRPIRISVDGTWAAEYSYMGVNTIVGTNQPETLMKNAYSLYSSGSSSYGTYMDRFNRSKLDSWTREIAGLTKPKVLNLATTYDAAGNVATVQDNVLMDSAGNHNFDAANTYDNLRRLKSRVEGTLSGTQSRIENYARNLAGRITSDQVSLDSNGNFDDGSLAAIEAGDMDDLRGYDNRNRLVGRSYYDTNNPSAGLRFDVMPTYDDNGNMTSDGEKYNYEYNPWGQLVRIRKIASPYDIQAEFQYNGLGQRIAEHLDTNNTSTVGMHAANTGYADGLVDGTDPWAYMAVDPKGRRVATFRDTDTYPKETFVYHLTSPGATSAIGGRSASGPNFANGGGVLVRDRDAALSNPTQWATTAANATRGERNYYCSDFRGNVSAMVDSGGGLVEQTRYSPSGVPYGIPLGDLDGNGTVDQALEDTTIVNGLIMAPAYEDRADLDLDGDVDGADKAIVALHPKLSAGRGVISAEWVGNRVGMCGNELFGNGLYTFSVANGQQIDQVGLGLNMTSREIITTSNIIKSAADYTASCSACNTTSGSMVSTVSSTVSSMTDDFNDLADRIFASCFSEYSTIPPSVVDSGMCGVWCLSQQSAQLRCISIYNEQAMAACGSNEACNEARRNAAGRAIELADGIFDQCYRNCINSARPRNPIEILPIRWPYPVGPGFPKPGNADPRNLPNYGLLPPYDRIDLDPRRGDFPPYPVPDHGLPRPIFVRIFS